MKMPDDVSLSTAWQIQRAVKERILSGWYPAGMRLTEQSLALEFGTSRTPAREAMRMLAAEGFLLFKPNSGSVVRTWSLEETRKLFDLRLLIESEIAALAAAHIDLHRIDALARIQDEAEQAGERLDTDALEQIARLNRDFHRIIAEASGDERLAAMLTGSIEVPIVQRTFKRYTASQLRRSFGHHRELVDAFRAHDSAWARNVMSCHIHAARHAMLDHADHDATR